MTVIPTHVAMIMDGNRRAGEADLGDKLKGHQEGVKRAEEIVQAAGSRGVSYVTLYAFSTENWRRSQEEVTTLFAIFRTFFDEEIDRLVTQGVRVRVIGRRDRLPSDILSRIAAVEERSQAGEGITLLIALDYGGRDELVRAAEKLRTERADSAVNEEALIAALDTVDVPDPDLVIRTGGEQRLSGFLLWQAAYAELYFTDTLWPHFDKTELEKALTWYAARHRRYGQ